MSNVKLGLPESIYIPSNLRKNYTEKQLREEYSRLRDIAQKRLQRLSKSEFKETEAYRKYKGAFVMTRKLEGSELPEALTEIADFLSSADSTVSGQKHRRNAFINTMHERGYDMVNKENYLDYIDFLDDLKTMHYGKIYSSDAINELYELQKEKGLAKTELYKNFDLYMKHKDELANIEWDDKKKHHTAAEFRKELGIDKEIARNEKISKALTKVRKK